VRREYDNESGRHLHRTHDSRTHRAAWNQGMEKPSRAVQKVSTSMALPYVSKLAAPYPGFFRPPVSSFEPGK